MFAAYCPRHQSVHLFGTHQITRLTTLEPGVIAVELTCGNSDRIVVLTGARVEHFRTR
jgi:hypothetical protein